ncbi:MAG TPA: type II toxin-antitoxin system VapC family toxin [Microlunatus sp.]
MARVKKLTVRRALDDLDDLCELPPERAGHRHPIRRCWKLRENLTVDDAAYVVLAELLSVPLVTADARLARAPQRRCDIEVLVP